MVNVIQYEGRNPQYICEGCGSRYITREQAVNCENKPTPLADYGFDWQVGDFVEVDYDDYECYFNYFGKIVGKHQADHIIYPVVRAFGYDEDVLISDYESITKISPDRLIESFEKMMGDECEVVRK